MCAAYGGKHRRRRTEESMYNHLFKMVLVGDSAVGKSNLLARFIGQDFDEARKSTIGVEFASKIVPIHDSDTSLTLCKAQIWDTAGQERYRAIASSYYRGAVGALLVYDVTRPRSLQNLDNWITELRKYADEQIVVAVVGNKIDLVNERQLAEKDVQDLIKKHNLVAHFEASAKTNENVEFAFESLVRYVYQEMKKKGLLVGQGAAGAPNVNAGNSTTVSLDPPKEQQDSKDSGCC